MSPYGNIMSPYGNIRSPLGNFREFFSISNHKANTTELHPKVRKTCILCSWAMLVARKWPRLLLSAATRHPLSRVSLPTRLGSKQRPQRKWIIISRVQSQHGAATGHAVTYECNERNRNRGVNISVISYNIRMFQRPFFTFLEYCENHHRIV